MKELNDIVTTKIASLIDDGTVEKLIADRLEKTIAESVNEAMKTWSPFGKAIKEKIETAINHDFDKLIFPTYNKFIAEVVEAKFLEVLKVEQLDHLKSLIDDALPPVQKVSKTSVLIERIADAWREECQEGGHEYIYVDVRTNDDETAQYITFKHPEYEFYNTRISFFKHRPDPTRWHIGYIEEGRNCVTGSAHNFAAHPMHDVTKVLFQFYAMGTRFEWDEDFEDIYVGHN